MNRSFKLAVAVAAIASIAAALGAGYWFGRQQPATVMADAAGATTVASPTPDTCTV